jgi:hypothetical protein
MALEEPCVINTSSLASLSLNRDDEIQNASFIGLDLAFYSKTK